MNKLNHHLRQYRHNNSDGLISGYEKEGTEAFVSCLGQEISELKAQIKLIKRRADELMDSNSGIEYSGKMDALLDVIDKTPHQCVAAINAGAINEAISQIKSKAEVNKDSSRELISHLDTCDEFANFAISLRKGKS